MLLWWSCGVPGYTEDHGGPLLPDPAEAETLTEARVLLHHAVLALGAFAATHLGLDEAHTTPNLGWDPSGVLVGRSVDGVHAALRVADLTLLVRDDQRVLAALPLTNRTLAEAAHWLRQTAARHGVADRALVALDYDRPSHPVEEGARFADPPTPALRQLAGWLDLAFRRLGMVCARKDAVAAPRLWPHHLDVGTVIPVDPDPTQEDARSILIGLSLGDGSIDAPYLYVSPWPYPAAQPTPPASAGLRWMTGGFHGLVLDGAAWDGTVRHLDAALDAGIAVSRGLLGPPRGGGAIGQTAE